MRESAAYLRGQIDGEYKTRLDGHDKRLDAVNGNIATLGGEMKGARSELERIANQMVADAKERVVVAAALKDEANVKATPITKYLSVAVVMLMFISIIMTVVAVAL